MKRWLLFLVLAACGCEVRVREPQVINPAEVDLWFGEETNNGGCWGEIAPAPGIPGKYSMIMTFTIKKNNVKDWIDYRLTPLPCADWSKHDKVYLYIYPDQACDDLHIKIVDQDIPAAINGNHSLYEAALLRDGKPLPARQWSEIEIPLLPEKEYKDSISYVGFYIPCSSDAPVGKDLVFYVGVFDAPRPAESMTPEVKPFELQSTELLSEDFESGLSDRWELSEEAKLAEKAEGVVSGKASAVGDSRASSAQWHQFLQTNPRKVTLKPGGTYLVSFDYRVLATLTEKDDSYYFLIRTPAGIQHDAGWQRWREPAGMSGARQAIVTLGDFPDYHLIFGVRYKGAIAIDNVKVSEIHNVSE